MASVSTWGEWLRIVTLSVTFLYWPCPDSVFGGWCGCSGPLLAINLTCELMSNVAAPNDCLDLHGGRMLVLFVEFAGLFRALQSRVKVKARVRVKAACMSVLVCMCLLEMLSRFFLLRVDPALVGSQLLP